MPDTKSLEQLLHLVDGLVEMSDRCELQYSNPRTGNVRPLQVDGIRQAVAQVRADYGIAEASPEDA